MAQENVVYRNDETRMAEEYMAQWLAGGSWTVEEWVDDFTGMNLPPLPPAEAYVWLLEGLGTGVAKAEREQQLARRLALVLESEPDRRGLDQRHRRALFSVLKLCSEVRVPETLAIPLRGMLQRALLPEIPFGYNLRLMLRQALIVNPPGQELAPLWAQMARGLEHPFLPADRDAAFDGALLLPPDEQGEFPVETMVEVLGALAVALQQDRTEANERDRRFRELVARVREGWADPRYDTRFWRESFLGGWPAWTTASIAREFGLPEHEVAEVDRYRSDLDRVVSEAERASVYNTATIFVLKSDAVGEQKATALDQQRVSLFSKITIFVQRSEHLQQGLRSALARERARCLELVCLAA